MFESLDEIRTYVCVVDAKSLSAAARSLRVSVNAVWRRLERIEERAGARLIERTTRTLLALRGRNKLLQDDYRLRLSIRLRNPYVDPISLLQVELLRRWRDAGREDDTLLQALVTTVNGISAGIQNTG